MTQQRIEFGTLVSGQLVSRPARACQQLADELAGLGCPGARVPMLVLIEVSS
jgi:hypothetical protein